MTITVKCTKSKHLIYGKQVRLKCKGLAVPLSYPGDMSQVGFIICFSIDRIYHICKVEIKDDSHNSHHLWMPKDGENVFFSEFDWLRILDFPNRVKTDTLFNKQSEFGTLTYTYDGKSLKLIE